MTSTLDVILPDPAPAGWGFTRDQLVTALSVLDKAGIVCDPDQHPIFAGASIDPGRLSTNIGSVMAEVVDTLRRLVRNHDPETRQAMGTVISAVRYTAMRGSYDTGMSALLSWVELGELGEPDEFDELDSDDQVWC